MVWIAVEDLIQAELMLCRFRKLMNEVRAGAIRRNSFEPWEVEILLDLMMCRVSRRRRVRLLPLYQKAVERQLERGNGPPIKLSEFLGTKSERPGGL